MSFGAWWHWFRTLKENPIYQREAGLIGEPNPFYKNLRKYTFLVFLLAISLGGCAGVSNRTILLSADSETAVLWLLICIPGTLISMITFYGMVLAPALTAPALGMELNKGTWEMLRLTPQPLSTVVLAKLFGGLRRLGIWRWLLGLTLFEGVVLFFGGLFFDSWVTMSVLGGITAVSRPWLEILFSAFLGMYLSTWIQTPSVTLAATYCGILLFRIFNNSILWLAIYGGIIGLDEGTTIALGLFSPMIGYIIALVILTYGIIRRAKNYV